MHGQLQRSVAPFARSPPRNDARRAPGLDVRAGAERASERGTVTDASPRRSSLILYLRPYGWDLRSHVAWSGPLTVSSTPCFFVLCKSCWCGPLFSNGPSR